jgi:hypothetical protein
VPGPCLDGGWPQPDQYGFSFRTTNRAPLAWDELRSEIYCGGRPVLFSWQWEGGGGHVMAVVGYETRAGRNYLKIADPLPTGLGEQRVIPYEAYVSGAGYTHGDDFYEIRRTLGASR